MRVPHICSQQLLNTQYSIVNYSYRDAHLIPRTYLSSKKVHIFIPLWPIPWPPTSYPVPWWSSIHSISMSSVFHIPDMSEILSYHLSGETIDLERPLGTLQCQPGGGAMWSECTGSSYPSHWFGAGKFQNLGVKLEQLLDLVEFPRFWNFLNAVLFLDRC